MEATDMSHQEIIKEGIHMVYTIYRDGKPKAEYTDALQAGLFLAMAKDMRPECKWEGKKSMKKKEVAK